MPLTLDSPDTDFLSAQGQATVDATKHLNPEAPQAPAASVGPATMVGADGKLYTVPEGSVAKALRHGWKQASPEDIAQEQKIKAGVAYNEEHRLETGLKRTGNEAALGVPQLIADKEAGPEQAALQQKIRERTEELHPLESGAEKALGFAAPLLIPGVGEVGEGVRLGIEGAARGAAEFAGKTVAREAEASLGRKLAASAGKMAAEGAIYSAPQAAVQAAYGDPEQAAETMLWGIGLSGALGAGGRLLGEGGKAIVRRAGEAIPSIAEHFGKVQSNGVTVVDDIARNVLGLSDKEAQKLGPTRLSRIVERADQEGLLAADPKARPGMIKSMLGDSGSKIGEHLEKLDSLLEDPEIAQHGPKPMNIARDFQQEVLSKHPELMSELHGDSLKFASGLEKEIMSGGSEASFSSLKRIEENIKSTMGDYDAKSVKGQIMRIARTTIKAAMEDSAQKIFEEGRLPERFADYVAQKERYETGKALMKGINEFKGTGRIPAGTGSLGLATLANIGVGAAGGPIGLGLAGLNIAREHAMKMFLRNEHGLLGKSVSFLRKAAADPASAPYIGGLMAKEGVSALTNHLDALPSYLSGSKTAARGTADAVGHLIGPTTGLSKAQQYDKLTATLQRAATDPGVTAQNVGGIASTFTGTSVQLASLVAQKKLAAVQYLQLQIPKNPSAPRPFVRDEWKPTAEQQKEFLSKVEVVHDPMVVWEHYQKGALTRSDRDTLKAVYPSTYTAMCHKILNMAYDPREPALDTAKRQQLSMFTGQPLDASLKNISSIQQALNTPQQSQQAGPQPGSKRASSRPKMHSPDTLTDSQRRTYGVHA